MSGMNDALTVIVPLLYMVGLFLYADLHHESRRYRVRPVLVAVAAVVAHGLLIGVRWRMLGHVPLSTTHDTLSALAFVMGLVYVFDELVTRIDATGFDVLTWPFAMVTIATAFGPHEPTYNEKLESPLFAMHTVPAVFALAAILTSGVYGLLYLRLARTMQRKNFGKLFQRLPDLRVLARMNFFSALAGLGLVTATIGFGATWYGDRIGRVDVTRPEIFVTLLMWVVLLFPVFGKAFRRWSDRATATVAVVTMGLVVVFFAILLLPLGSFHG